MGSLRGMTELSAKMPLALGLITIAVMVPGTAWAAACDSLRPLWDGVQASAVDEALHLAATLPSVALVIITALALRFRSQWGGLAAVVGWSLLVSVHVFPINSDPVRESAITEGCIGSPALFIAVVAAICIGTILYTAPIGRRSND